MRIPGVCAQIAVSLRTEKDFRVHQEIDRCR